MDNAEFVVTSMLGVEGGAMVVFEAPMPKCTISVEDARALAMSLLRAAEASEQDELMFRFLTETVGSTVDQATLTIRDLREFRRVEV